MAVILGLDLGSHTLKGVWIDTQLRTAQVKGWAEVPRTAGEDGLRADLAALVASHPLRADQVVVSLQGSGGLILPIALPFSDPRKIDATLPFEIEDQLPFDLDEAVYDYQPLAELPAQSGPGTGGEAKAGEARPGVTATGGPSAGAPATSDEPRAPRTRLLVAVSRQDQVEAVIGALAAEGLDPRVVTMAPMAYHTLLLRPPGEEEPSGQWAIVDLGHERVSVAIGRPGHGLELARSFPGGGRGLDRALARDLGVEPDEARAWKEQHAALAGRGHGPEGERAEAVLTRALAPLVRELRATFKAAGGRGRPPVGRLLLCGGTAALPGLGEHLSKALAIPSSPLWLGEGEESPLQPAGPRAALPYALALRGQVTAARHNRVNLRRGALAFKGDFTFLRAKAGTLGAYAASLLILLLAYGITRNTLLERREEALSAELCRVTERVLGRCERDFDRAINLLRGQESPAAAIPDGSALTSLAALTQRVPQDLPVTFEQVTLDLDRIALRGRTSQSSEVDTLTQAIRGYRCFNEVRQGKLERSRTGDDITFRLDIEVECPEARGNDGED